MDRTQTLVVALLVIAILFSAASIFISVSVSNFNLPQNQVTGQVAGGGSGGLEFNVERSVLQEGLDG